MMPQSSPCAPAAGLNAIAGMPVSVLSQCASVSISSSAPGTVDDRLQRMDVGEAGQARQFFVEARVVLHRAGAERVEPAVDRVILLRQPGEVAHDLRLAETRAGRSVPCRSRPPRRLRNGAGSGRSTPQCPGESCSKISLSSICKPAIAAERSRSTPSRPASVSARRPGSNRSSTAPRASLLRAGPCLPSVVISVAATSRRSASRVVVRIEAADRNPGEDALSGERLDDLCRRPRQPQRELVEEGCG